MPCRKVRDSALVVGLSMLSKASAATCRPLCCCCCCSQASTATRQGGYTPVTAILRHTPPPPFSSSLMLLLSFGLSVCLLVWERGSGRCGGGCGFLGHCADASSTRLPLL